MSKLIDLNGLAHFKDKENEMIAADYSATKTYAVGDYVYYNGTLYRCTTAIATAEAWTSGHWTAAKIGDDVTELKSAVDHNDNNILANGYTYNEYRYIRPTDGKLGSSTTTIVLVPCKPNTTYKIWKKTPTTMRVACASVGSLDAGTATEILFLGSEASSNEIIVTTTSTGSYLYIQLYVTSDDAAYQSYSANIGTLIVSECVKYQTILGTYNFGMWNQGSYTSSNKRISPESLQRIALPTRIEVDNSIELAVDIFSASGVYQYHLGWQNCDLFVQGNIQIGLSIRYPDNSSMSGIQDLKTFFNSKVKIRTSEYQNECKQLMYGNVFASMSMFPTIGVLGDSFASGSLYHVDDTSVNTSNYDLSWPKDLGRNIGSTITRFSKGGLSTKGWLENSEYGLSALLAADKQDLYICNFGINDYTEIVTDHTFTLGTIADCNEDYTQNPESFYGCYGRIIGNILNYSPYSKIVLVSVIRYNERKNGIDTAIEAIANFYSIPFINVVDDDFFVSAQFRKRMSSNHPLAPTYSGIAMALKRLIEKDITDNTTYWDSYYGNTP